MEAVGVSKDSSPKSICSWGSREGVVRFIGSPHLNRATWSPTVIFGGMVLVRIFLLLLGVLIIIRSILSILVV